MPTPTDIVKRCMRAYVDKDRAAIEAVIADDFHFTSPYDNRIDRKTYFEICWPNSANTKHFAFERLVEAGDTVIVTYTGTANDGRKFRNTEIMTIRDGRISDVEVYVGWTIPHDAPDGKHIDPK